ncbi:uncharacterized protein C8Q71DRAFT_311686 [Rhodofomes roseus]|uniref:Uncharacterized protein n=1 Tax=Rhodofomes roseus TaxID=34475 RepID=A0ABQ8K392_9APHY|nr:uncharacterized protein C8Q71DRAFT_311686 [Rhodofomes roseus]KAH9831253.1 hypothetical protein C8Q71DRAFT_311686 [Rhodofomes roseus]
MSAEPTKFPSPIGGVPNQHDLAPAVVFAVAYAITIPLVVYRLTSKKSRNIFCIATAVFAIERVVDFSFRAVEAEKPNLRTTSFWVNWLQSAYTMGFISIAGDVGNIARVFLLKSTRGSDPSASAAAPSLDLLASSGTDADEERPAGTPKAEGSAAASMTMFDVREAEVLEDEPKRRTLIERWGLVTLLMRLTALALGGVYSGFYFGGTTDHSKAVTAQQTRYASDIIMVVYLQLVIAVLLWAYLTRPKRVARRPTLFLVAICLLLDIPAIYRLAAMANYTDSLLSMAPGSLNGPHAKAVFYVLHIAPELFAGTLLMSVNVREVYGVGGGMRG